MITPLFVLFSKTILTQEVTMDFYFLINCSTSLYNRPKIAIVETQKKEKWHAVRKAFVDYRKGILGATAQIISK